MRADEALHVLGLSSSATPTEIKAAYRRLVKASHPDRHASDEERRAGAEETIKRIIEAYQCVRHGIPPLEPASHQPHSDAGSASMFSVRPTTPFAGQATRRSPPRRATRRGRRRSSHVAAWMAFSAAIGVFLAISQSWFRDTSLVTLDWSLGTRGESLTTLDEAEGQGTTQRVDVKATRVGHTWRVQNTTRRAWSRCRAWVGAKSAVVHTIGPGATLSLPATVFGPPLSDFDDGKALEFFCAPPS